MARDQAGRTKEEVTAYLRSVSVTDAELESTFGPNWRGVVSVVRQAAALTPEQAERLHVARDAARDAALDAARDAALVAALGSRHAAWVAARHAAVATVVRDLITDEQYRTLAGPWISVMGEIEGAA